MNLYPILAEHKNLLSIVEENEGEVTAEIMDALQLTQERFEAQALSVGYVAKALDDREEAIKKEIDRLKGLLQRTQDGNNKIRQVLRLAMLHFGVEKIKGDTLQLSFRKSESVEINPDVLPQKYFNEKVTYTADKLKIKDCLKAGIEIPGAALITNQNLQIK